MRVSNCGMEDEHETDEGLTLELDLVLNNQSLSLGVNLLGELG